MEGIYKNIKNLRIQNNMSQAELAEAVGYTDRSSIAKIEKGEVDLSKSKIEAFANAFQVSIDYLLGHEENDQKEDKKMDVKVSINVTEMKENKQAICDALLPSLQKTRHLSDLISLRYDEKLEIVIALFENRSTKLVNVAMDSGIAMIQDITEQL